MHSTPQHASRLNQAEMEISLCSRHCLGQRGIPALGNRRREAKAWDRKMNCHRVTIGWQYPRKNPGRKFEYNRSTIA